MDNQLAKLGIRLDVLALFQVHEPVFDYGDSRELFAETFHYVPCSRNLWIAGNRSATQVVIARSAMDTLAYLSLCLARIQNLETVCLATVGTQPGPAQMQWIARTFNRRKITLLFERDLVGCATDIAVACWLRNIPVRLRWTGEQLAVRCAGTAVAFDPEQLTLNAFEKAFGLRLRIRTRKPSRHANFLTQLTYDTIK